MSAPEVNRALARWLKFNTVGAGGIAAQLLVLTALTSGMHCDYRWATALAVETAVLHNFLWHQRFTWADRAAGSLRGSALRLFKFNLSNGLVSLVGNVWIMQWLVGAAHWPPLAANLVAIAVCALANFVLSDRLVFV
jgi:putative flippase GtrA